MKKTEMRKVEIYYCDVCGNECGLPYYGKDNNGYGECCSSKISRADRYLVAVNTIRKGIGMRQIDVSFESLTNIINNEHDKAHGRELEPSGTDEIS